VPHIIVVRNRRSMDVVGWRDDEAEDEEEDEEEDEISSFDVANSGLYWCDLY
jgi:hypothetical protein